MKKLLSLILTFTMLLSVMLLASCKKENTNDNNTNNDNTETPPEEIRVITLAGPTGMGMAKLMDDAAEKKTNYNYNFTVSSDPTQVSPEVIKGNYDIAAVPVNLASTLYNKTEGQLKVAAVNTLGVLYVLENGNTINSISDLKGKTVYATGQGSTPEYILRYVLEKNNIDPEKDLKIEFLSEHAELAAKLKTGNVAIGMLPEPQVTAATTGESSARIALNLTEEWSKVSDYKLIQGCIIVRKEFAEKYPKTLEGFLNEYKASVEYVNSNIDDASLLIEKAGIVPKAAVAKKALPNCNICFITGEEMKNCVSQMLNVLYTANAASVGGKLPGDELYY